MKNYFAGLKTPDEIKKRYYKLAMQFHPDRGGCLDEMKAINNAYQAALEQRHETEFEGNDGKQHTYYYNESVETDVMDKIMEVLAQRLNDDIRVVLIGRWVWVTGTTKADKDNNTPTYQAMIECKMRYHSKRKCWYWHPPTKRKTRYNPNVNLDGLAAAYGGREFDTEQRKRTIAQ